MNQVISEATRRNWNRLNTEESSRLTKIANKRLSSKKIVPVEYFANKSNQKIVVEILTVLDDADILSLMFFAPLQKTYSMVLVFYIMRMCKVF